MKKDPIKRFEILQSEVASDQVTVQQVTQAFTEDVQELVYIYSNQDILTLHRSSGTYYGLGHLDHLSVSYGEYTTPNYVKDGASSWTMNRSQYFAERDVKKAIECFVDRLGMPNPKHSISQVSGDKLSIIKIKTTGILMHESHYDYLDEMVNPFWMQVFGKTADQMYCGGMVSAHGDKAYGYRSYWDEQGIPFHHGVLLYFLSYTDEMGQTPKHKSCQWVIDNYAKYFLHIQEAEREVLKNVYNQTSCKYVEFCQDEDNPTRWVACINDKFISEHICESKLDVVRAYLEQTKTQRVDEAQQASNLRAGRFS